MKKSGTVTILICLAIIFLGGYFLTKPLIGKLKEKNIQIDAKEKDISAMQSKISDLQTASSQMKTGSKELELLNLAWPPDEGLPEVLVSVEAMAGRAGLSVQAISPASGQQSNTGEVPVTVTVSGNFSNIITFSQILEKNLRPIKIKSIAIAASTAKDARGVGSTYNIAMLYQPSIVSTAEGQASTDQNNSQSTSETQP